jgi:hypothetical protein
MRGCLRTNNGKKNLFLFAIVHDLHYLCIQ